MAVRKFIIVAGQSNASAIGDTPTWWSANPFISLASPAYDVTQLPQYAQGAYDDLFTMPGTFKGGPQVDQYGLNESVNGQWQQVNLRGVAVQKIRFLTLYNPIASFLSFGLFAQDYPGIARVQEGSEPSRLNANLQQQPAESGAVNEPKVVTFTLPNIGNLVGHGYTGGELLAFTSTAGTAGLPDGMDARGTFQVASVPTADTFTFTAWPSGDAVELTSVGSGTLEVHRAERGTIVRQSTGTTHTAACAGPGTQGSASTTGATINVSPPFNPPPVYGEQFTYQFRVSSGTPGRLVFETGLGGLVDTGHATAGGQGTAIIRNPDGDHGTQITTRNSPYYAGRPVQFAPTAVLSAVTAADDTAETVTILANPYTDDDRIQFTDGGGGSLPTGLAFDTPYYVVNTAGDAVQLATTQGGAAINFTGGVSGVIVTSLALPSPLVQGTTYYVSRVGEGAEVDAFAGAATVVFASDKFDFGIDHRWVEGEPVVLSAPANDDGTASTLPSGLLAGQVYYVKLTGTVDEIQLSESEGGAAVTLGDAGSGRMRFERLDQRVSWWVSATPGGKELVIDEGSSHGYTPTMQPVFRGSLSGLRVRCVSGTQALIDDGPRNLKHAELDVANDAAEVVLDEAFSTSPAAGDVFVIEPASGVAFKDYALWLPWCPFEGQAQGSYPLPTVNAGPAASDDSDIVLSGLSGAVEWAPCRLYTTGQLPEPLAPGREYFMLERTVNSTKLAATWDDETVVQQTEYVVSSVNASAGTERIYFAANHLRAENDAVQFYGADVATIGLVEGTVYYVDKIDDTTIELLDAPGGSTVTLTGLASPSDLRMVRAVTGTHVLIRSDQWGKRNPYPPGFNFPNHADTPTVFQPYAGPLQIGLFQRMGPAVSIAMRVAEHEGENIDVLQLTFGGTSLGHKEVMPAALAGLQGMGWSDVKQQIHWSPGEPNGCYAVMQDRLRQARAAYEAAGDTGECVGIFWVQGEEDASYEVLANRYEDNLESFVEVIRADVKANELTSGPADALPFVAAKVFEPSGVWPYAATVNAAIQAVADGDVNMRAADTSTLSVQTGDTAHYTGGSMSELGGTLMFEQWKGLRENEDAAVQFCNRALRHLGESTTIVSIAPPDEGVLAATLCAEFYPVARDTLLARHAWDFSVKRVSPVALAASGRTEWLYAYKLPSDFNGVVKVLPKDSPDDTHVTGRRLDLEHDVVIDANEERRLVCNEPDVILYYHANITDTSKFSALFEKALTYELAAMLAPPILKGDKGMEAARLNMQMSAVFLDMARAQDGDRMREKRVQDTGLSEAHNERGPL